VLVHDYEYEDEYEDGDEHDCEARGG